MYYKGQGVPQDDAEAVKWYRCCRQGDAWAQYLGAMYDRATASRRITPRR